ALTTLEKVLEIDPEYVDAYCLLGDVYIDIGKYDKAREMIEKALELDPDGAEPHCKMAMYCLSQGDFKGLREEYRILKDLDPALASQIGGLFFDEA
ncbi:MAG: tetratricopeptide repeat protein, partial [Chlorobium sp.]|nr:tetratricopeptide repeat protein [Chlorobium sp.]